MEYKKIIDQRIEVIQKELKDSISYKKIPIYYNG